MVEASALAVVANNVRLGIEAAAAIFAAVVVTESVLAIAGVDHNPSVSCARTVGDFIP